MALIMERVAEAVEAQKPAPFPAAHRRCCADLAFTAMKYLGFG
ncbi:MAG TPA: hypothetical protein VFN77_10435 [Acetobacteraceae bacterium]|nr:hypothetical protein [Acetobacteraceae bacterium]